MRGRALGAASARRGLRVPVRGRRGTPRPLRRQHHHRGPGRHVRRLLRGRPAGGAVPTHQGQRPAGRDRKPHARLSPRRRVGHARRATVGFGGSGSSPKARSRRPRSSRPSSGPTPSCSARGACTSTIPALLGAGVSGALAEFGGPVIYAANIMTQPGETVGCTLSDHLVAIAEHVGPVVTDVLVHRSGCPRRWCPGTAPREPRRSRSTAGRSSGSACACALRRCSRTRSARRPGTTPSGLRVPCSTWRLPERRRCVRLPEGSAAAVTGPASAWRGGPSGPPP